MDKGTLIVNGISYSGGSGGTGGGGEVYSKTETEIGTWHDGRKIYRCVYDGLAALTIGNSWIPTTVSKGDKSLIVNSGIINYGASGGRAVVEAAFLNGYLNVRSYRTVEYEASNYCLILEYVKEV